MNIIGHGKRNLAKLLTTGQLTSYGSGTGVDDGALRKGIVKRYTILTTGQYSGTTNITINGKTDVHSNNCVFDDNTGLMWSRYVSASVGPASNGLLTWTTNGSGEGVFPYVAAANTASLAGYTDWDIPNIDEGNSLIDKSTGAPNTIAFPTIISFWSSTTDPITTPPAYALFIGYQAAIIMQSRDKTLTRAVLLVRGGR